MLLLRPADIPPVPLRVARACGAVGAEFPPRVQPQCPVDDVRGPGMMVSAALGNDRATVARLIELGADLVDSDMPALALAARDELVAV